LQRVGAGTRRTHLAGWIAAIAVTAVVVVVAGGAIATRATSPSASASLLQVVNTYEHHEGTVRGTSRAERAERAAFEPILENGDGRRAVRRLRALGPTRRAARR